MSEEAIKQMGQDWEQRTFGLPALAIGDIVDYEPESLDRLVADIDAWCGGQQADPVEFILELRERMGGLREAVRAMMAAYDQEDPLP